uniref:Putative ovule protein n=1 Tax=Solanum chacoense TaxID=4108 RepID=A0A0V0HUH8_SOLCH
MFIIYLSRLGLSNGRAGLKSEILKLVETEIGLGPDPLKFTVGSNGLGSNGLKNGLGLDPPNLTLLIQ